MKNLFEILAYDTCRHIIETVEFPELEPPDKLEIVMTGHLEDVKYTVKGKPRTILMSSTSYGKAKVASLSTTEDVRNHMFDVLNNSFVTQITSLLSSSSLITCMSSSDIIRLLGREKNDEYTKLVITATYEDAFTSVRIVPVDDKRDVLFQSFVLMNDNVVPIIEMFKTVKNHKCAMTHVKRAFRISFPFHESFVTVTRERGARLFDYLTDTPQCYDKGLVHDELVEAAYHPDRLQNVLDENDDLFDRWQ
jgi:hypothetical protein